MPRVCSFHLQNDPALQCFWPLAVPQTQLFVGLPAALFQAPLLSIISPSSSPFEGIPDWLSALLPDPHDGALITVLWRRLCSVVVCVSLHYQTSMFCGGVCHIALLCFAHVLFLWMSSPIRMELFAQGVWFSSVYWINDAYFAFFKATNKKGQENYYTAAKFVIATGERPRYLGIAGDKEHCVTR
jgi:hypothetical protein